MVRKEALEFPPGIVMKVTREGDVTLYNSIKFTNGVLFDKRTQEAGKEISRTIISKTSRGNEIIARYRQSINNNPQPSKLSFNNRRV